MPTARVPTIDCTHVRYIINSSKPQDVPGYDMREVQVYYGLQYSGILHLDGYIRSSLCPYIITGGISLRGQNSTTLRITFQRKITHPTERISELVFSKPQGAHNVNMVASVRSRRDLSIDGSLGVYPLPVLYKTSFETRRGGVISSRE